MFPHKTPPQYQLLLLHLLILTTQNSHSHRIFNSDPNRGCEDKCCYCEDYSQYVLRGHYTRSEKLKRYFKVMMWYGRMAFHLKGGNVSECSGIETPLITEKDAKTATIQASLLSTELPEVKIGNTTAQELWTHMYLVTAFFVGAADDLTPYDYVVYPPITREKLIDGR